jgi:hypothetical protein
MIGSDFKTFAALWVTAHELSSSNAVPSNQAVSMAFDVLSGFSLAMVQDALKQHARSSRFAPVPADVFGLLASKLPQHVGADEAWSLALASFDESATVVLTAEISQARAAAWPVWECGDKVGARMAFKAAYERAMAGAGVPVWYVSEGFDADARGVAVAEAVRLGRVGHEVAARYALPAPAADSPIAGLLAGKVDDRLKGKWSQALAAYQASQARVAAVDAAKAAAKVKYSADVEARRAEQLARVDELMGVVYE